MVPARLMKGGGVVVVEERTTHQRHFHDVRVLKQDSLVMGLSSPVSEESTPSLKPVSDLCVYKCTAVEDGRAQHTRGC